MGRSSWMMVVVALAAVAAGCGESEAGRASKGSHTDFADGVIVVPEPPSTPVLPGAPRSGEPGGSGESPSGVAITAADCEALVPADGRRIHVDPTGSDAAEGTADAPLATIQAALDDAQPGDTVVLAPGLYAEDVRTVRDGTPAAPIAIIGTPEAVVTGGGEDRVFVVDHDHHLLCGFGIDDNARGDASL